jgi:predicted nucleic acid-binding protein
MAKLIKKVLLDTNILLYADDMFSVNHTICNKLIQSKNYQFFVTDSILYEYYRVLTSNNAKFSKIKKADVVESLEIFASNFTVLYSSENSLFSVIELCKNEDARSGAIFDVAISAVAFVNEMDAICTYNGKDYLNSGIKVLKPDKLVG